MGCIPGDSTTWSAEVVVNEINTDDAPRREVVSSARRWRMGRVDDFVAELRASLLERPDRIFEPLYLALAALHERSLRRSLRGYDCR
jgi:hypothetical protein